MYLTEGEMIKFMHVWGKTYRLFNDHPLIFDRYFNIGKATETEHNYLQSIDDTPQVKYYENIVNWKKELIRLSKTKPRELEICEFWTDDEVSTAKDDEHQTRIFWPSSKNDSHLTLPKNVNITGVMTHVNTRIALKSFKNRIQFFENGIKTLVKCLISEDEKKNESEYINLLNLENNKEVDYNGYKHQIKTEIMVNTL